MSICECGAVHASEKEPLCVFCRAARYERLRDGIRALADVCDVYDTDDVRIDPKWVTKRLRAIMGKDGE